MQDVPITAAGVSIAKDSGNEVSAQGKRNLALLPGKEPCGPAPLSGAKTTLLLLQGVMKWWRDPAKRQKATDHRRQRWKMRTGWVKPLNCCPHPTEVFSLCCGLESPSPLPSEGPGKGSDLST